MAKNAETRKKSRENNEVTFLVQIALSNRGTATERGAIQKMRRMAKDPEVGAFLHRMLSELSAAHEAATIVTREANRRDSCPKELERRLVNEMARRLRVSVAFVDIDVELLPED